VQQYLVQRLLPPSKGKPIPYPASYIGNKEEEGKSLLETEVERAKGHQRGQICHFRNVTGWNPNFADPRDSFLLVSIWQVILDVLCA
jgi:hypothetical protein